MKLKTTNFANWLHEYGIKCVILVTYLILNSCTNGGSSTSNGQLFFTESNVVVASNTFSVLSVELTASSNTNGNILANVTVTSSNPNVISVSPSNCGIANQGFGWINTCQIIISSLNYGSAIIMASAPGFSSATAHINVVNTLSPGYLAFFPSRENIALGSSRNISLNLVNAVNVNNFVVTISNSSLSTAISNLGQCVLSSLNPTCTLTISGVNLGNTTLTATAESYTATTNSVSVINNSIPGILSAPLNLSVAPGAAVPVTITLGDSSGITNLNVSLTSQNSNAQIAPNTCTLSTVSPTCQVYVVGEVPGTDNIIVSAPGHASTTILTTITQNPSPGTFSFSSTSENVTIDGSNQVILSYAGGTGINNVPITLKTNNSHITISPTNCTIGGSNPPCVITIAGNSLGQTTITASSPGYSNVTNSVQVLSKTTIVYGSLSLSPANPSPIQVNASIPFVLSLNNSVGVNNLPVTLSTNQSGVVQLNKNNCTLSSMNNTCTFNVTALVAGTTTITASAQQISNPALASVTVNSDVTPGQFNFDTNHTTVDVNGDTTINLVYTGGSNTFDVPITISTSNNNASILFPSNPTQCFIGDGINNSCQIMILGNTIGTSQLIAQSPGYLNATSSVTIAPSHTIDYGNLSISPETSDVNLDSSTSLKITLNNSYNVENLNVNLTAKPANIVQFVNTSSCQLSTVNNTCYVIVNGITYGPTVITASTAKIASSPTALIQVVNPNNKPYLVWDNQTLGVGTSAGGTDAAGQPNTGQSLAILRLHNGTVVPITVRIPANDPTNHNIIIGGYYPQQNACTLTGESPVCVFKVVNNSTNNSGESATFTAEGISSNGESTPPARLNVIAANIASPSRKITVFSYCPFPIYVGISGGSTANGSQPTGSVESNGIYYWINPTPTNSPNTNPYLLNQDESLLFVVPAGNSMDPVGVIWGGGISARLVDSSGTVITSRCSASESTNLGACPIGSGFNTPQTVAEFSLLANGPDTYDVQNIDGVTVPILIQPSSYDNQVIPSGIDPYNNGIAGSLESASGIHESTSQGYSIGASSWQFNPGSTTAVLNDDPSIYNLVIPVVPSTPCSESMPCSINQVCGYSPDSLDPNLTNNHPTFALVCGTRIAYLTAAAIWALDPDAPIINQAPFQYESILATSKSESYPNSSNHPMHDFFMCNNGLQSGYSDGVTYPNACGCSNWDGLTTPAKQCEGTGAKGYSANTQNIGFNSAWLNYVLPRVQWVKNGCPTCYAFQYDDEASTFVAWTSSQQAASNPVTRLNYTVTFCPNGIHIPQSD